jgi:hypothetical protein
VSAILVDLGAVPGAVAAVVAVPVQNPEPPPGQGAEFGKSSPIALVVIVLLGLATVVLIRSMTKHLRRVPVSFDKPDEDTEGTGPAERNAEDAGGGRA